MGFVFFLGLRLRVSCLRVDRWDGRMDIRSSWNISSWHRHTRNNARISKVPYCICLCFTQCPLTSSVGGARTTQISLAVSSRVRSDRSHLASPLDHTSFVNRIAHSEKQKKKRKRWSCGQSSIYHIHWTRRHMVPGWISKEKKKLSLWRCLSTDQAAIDLLPCLSQSGTTLFFSFL